MANSKAIVLAALCTIIIFSTFIGSTHSASCCLKYVRNRRQLSCKRMLGYTIQNINNSCDINAVIFHLQGRFVCADPAQGWTQARMRCLDERMKKIAEILKAGTVATNTTSTNA